MHVDVHTHAFSAQAWIISFPRVSQDGDCCNFLAQRALERSRHDNSYAKLGGNNLLSDDFVSIAEFAMPCNIMYCNVMYVYTHLCTVSCCSWAGHTLQVKRMEGSEAAFRQIQTKAIPCASSTTMAATTSSVCAFFESQPD